MEKENQILSEAPAVETAGELAPPLEEVATVQKKPEGDKHGFWKDEWKRVKKYRRLLWFLLPALLISFIFSYIPMFGILIAFKGPEFNIIKYPSVMYNLVHGSWTLKNFAEIFYDVSIVKAIGNTLLINVLRLAICFPFSIIIAVQLSELKSQTLAKVILIIISIPNFLSWVIVIGIWAGFLNPDTGFFGKVIGFFIMGESEWFKVLVVALSAWKSAGWGCILYYSAICAIDKTYYESATLEGANRLQKMWYLTIPSILPTIALTLVLNISGLMATGLEQIYTMMQINPGTLRDSQIVLDTYIYDLTKVDRNEPLATALGVFNGLIGLTLMLVGNAITTKTMKRGLW